MRNQFGQVIDCFEIFDTPMHCYDLVIELLTDMHNQAKLGIMTGRAEYAARIGGDDDVLHLAIFEDGCELSFQFVTRDIAPYKAGQVILFAYTLLKRN